MITACRIHSPEQESPGIWAVTVSVDGVPHKLRFDVEGSVVQSFHENPELQALLPKEKGAMFNFQAIVGGAYRILQDHIAPEGAPAHSFSYRLATGIIRRQVEAEASAT